MVSPDQKLCYILELLLETIAYQCDSV